MKADVPSRYLTFCLQSEWVTYSLAFNKSFNFVLLSCIIISSAFWAAIIEYHRLGGLNNRNLFLPVLEAGKSRLKVPADLLSSKSPLPGSQMAIFLMSPRMT